MTITKKCVLCGNSFTSEHKIQKYCSSKCKYNVYNSSEKCKTTQKKYRETHQEQERERHRKYAQTTRGRLLLRERQKRYAKRHPERVKETRKRYYLSAEGQVTIGKYRKSDARKKTSHKYTISEKGRVSASKHSKTEKFKIQQRRFRQTEKGQRMRRHIVRTYRTRKAKTIEKWTMKEWEKKLKATNGICPCCKEKVGISKLALDHIIPIAIAPEGTEYWIDDVQPLCKKCNAAKGTRSTQYV